MTVPAPPPARGALAGRLGHRFVRPALYTQALTHRSHGLPHNERLEFIGDAVLDCVISAILYQRFPDLPEGDLSRARAGLVNGDTLARLARGLGVGAELLLGEGEQKSGGAARPSILADALEALFGAVFVDAGFDAAQQAIVAVYGELLDDPMAAGARKDPKTRLQEWLQARRTAVPEYVVVAVAGEAHAQQFTVECRIPSFGVATRGEGTSRRHAEQQAAEAALAALGT